MEDEENETEIIVKEAHLHSNRVASKRNKCSTGNVWLPTLIKSLVPRRTFVSKWQARQRLC